MEKEPLLLLDLVELEGITAEEEETPLLELPPIPIPPLLLPAANVDDATAVVAANVDSSFDVDKALAEAEEIEARL